MVEKMKIPLEFERTAAHSYRFLKPAGEPHAQETVVLKQAFVNRFLDGVDLENTRITLIVEPR